MAIVERVLASPEAAPLLRATGLTPGRLGTAALRLADEDLGRLCELLGGADATARARDALLVVVALVAMATLGGPDADRLARFGVEGHCL